MSREDPAGAILLPLTAIGRVALAAEVFATYAGVRWRMWRGDLNSTVAALRDRPGAWREPGLETLWQGVRLSKATTRTLSLLPTDTRCLMQSLVLLGMLSCRRIEAVLIVAVKAEPEFEAHAWIEHDDKALLPTEDHERLVEL